MPVAMLRLTFVVESTHDVERVVGEESSVVECGCQKLADGCRLHLLTVLVCIHLLPPPTSRIRKTRNTQVKGLGHERGRAFPSTKLSTGLVLQANERNRKKENKYLHAELEELLEGNHVGLAATRGDTTLGGELRNLGGGTRQDRVAHAET